MNTCAQANSCSPSFWSQDTRTPTGSCTINPESGGIVAPAVEHGLIGPCEVYRSVQESNLVRFNPDVSSQAVARTYDAPFMSLVTPDKPAPVTLAGYDVFGPPTYNTSTRNMTTDLRGEAATGPIVGEPPIGGAINSRMGSAMQFDNRFNGCSYVPPPYPGGSEPNSGASVPNACPLSGRDPGSCGGSVVTSGAAKHVKFYQLEKVRNNVVQFFRGLF